MKKLFIVAIATLLTSSVFTSCTENTTINDDQLIFESQGIEKKTLQYQEEWAKKTQTNRNLNILFLIFCSIICILLFFL